MSDDRLTAEQFRRLSAQSGPPARRNKFGSVPRTVDGIRFASTLEANRYGVLKMLRNGGIISDLLLQPKFMLVVKGTKVGEYWGDFLYTSAGRQICEDTKGLRLPLYILKAKLMAVLYPHIELREITR